MGSGCFVDVLQGDHWLQFAAVLPKPELQALVAAVANQVSSAKGGEGVTAGPEWAIACDDVLPAAQRTASLGGSLQLDKAVAPVQPVMFHAAIVRSAGGHCYWCG